MPIASYARKQALVALREEPKFLSVWQVAELMGVHERPVRRWLAWGWLEGLNKGGKGFLIPKVALVDFMCDEGRDEGDDDE
jgi:excisionase family DNA binding protein